MSIAESEPILLNVGQVGVALGVSKRTVWRLTSTGELPPPLRIGRAVRWNRQSLVEWASQWEGVRIETRRSGDG